jgi:release factor glutamine methyltransferase
MSESWTIGRVVRWATDDFKARGLSSPRLDAEVLLAYALGIERMRILVDHDRPLSPDELARYKELIRRRRTHEPVAYLRGEREFYGRTFRVDRNVLIPRPDTEALVDVALERTAPRSAFGRALDLCTGSGCVAITFARERPTWRVDAIDVSPAALAVARDNAHRLGAIWNVRWMTGDLFAPLTAARDVYELVTANPPYIPDEEVLTLDADVRDHEPRLALAGGADGLSLTRRIVDGAPQFLAPGGVLALEVMAGTSDAVSTLLDRRGYSAISVRRDYGGNDRVVSGISPPSSRKNAGTPG